METKRLLIEVLLVSGKFVLSTHAPSPPGLKKAATIAHELDEGSTHAEESNLHAVILTC